MGNMDGLQIVVRRPRREDGARIHALVKQCPPLDVNSEYCYLLLCSHFAATCTVAERDGELLGFQTGYIRPDEPAVLFIWQIAVGAEGRGAGLGTRMVEDLLQSLPPNTIRYLEQTVTKSNAASRALFESIARRLDTTVEESLLFDSRSFSSGNHESEYLLRIGPIARTEPVTQETTEARRKRIDAK